MFLIFTVALLCLMYSCSKDEVYVKPKAVTEQNDEAENTADDTQNKVYRIQLTQNEWKISKGSIDLGFKFLKAFNENVDGSRQYVISPLSLSYALAMLVNGADQETQAEILKAMNLDDCELADMNSLYQKLVAHLGQVDNFTTMGIANMMWMNNRYAGNIYDSYKQTLQDYYSAELMQTDAKDAKDTINNWCAAKTNNLIKKFLGGEVSDVEKLMLINALYFKGMWTYKFDKANTKIETFNNYDGTTSEVEMMNMKTASPGDFSYDYCSDFAIAGLPFGNDAFEMFFILPNEGKNINQCIDTIVKNGYYRCDTRPAYAYLKVKIPKFDISTKGSISGALASMGIKRIFSSEATYPYISEMPLQLSNVMQAAKLSINEEYSEGAAVTSFGWTTSAGGESGGSYKIDTIEYYVNRPFAFMVRERYTNSVLFVGKVSSMKK